VPAGRVVTPLLAARGLERRYADRVVVADLSFELAPGEIFGFLGENGAGKTTTFEMLSGLRRPDRGHLEWRGARIEPTAAAYRARLGVVFQQASVDQALTARENLQLGAALYGLTGAAARAKIDAALAFTELGARAHEPVKKFSGGMRRRLELARVLMHEPELLVLDEPTHGLDPGFFRRFWAELRRLRETRGLTVLVTTHDPAEAAQADRLAVLDAGRVLALGSPAELTAQVGGDVLVVEADDAAALVEPIRARHGLEARVAGDGKLLVTLPRAHELVPRLVEGFPPGRLRSVAVHPPDLADVFVRLTGRTYQEAA
jgi:ABC-2 type transport system ATP-binding protein